MRTFVLSVRTVVLIAFLVVASHQAHSQSLTTGNGKVEFGLGLGPMFFLGDLGGHQGVGKTFIKDLNLPLTKFSTGLFLNVYPAEWLGFRIALNHGKVEGYDNIINDKNGDEYFRKLRNLQFRSNILEAYVAAEVYPTVFFERYEELQGKLRPYGIIGIGLFKFNPKGEYFDENGTGRWVALQPLHTEGEGMAEYPDRKNYKLTQAEIPMGFGAKYYLKENFYIGMEVLHRKTFTDYIDDVSTNYIDQNLFDDYLTPQQAKMARQLNYRENYPAINTRPDLNEQRGNPKQNDAFFSTILKMGWRLQDPNSPESRAARQVRCPSFY
jgi:hypothetical protein